MIILAKEYTDFIKRIKNTINNTGKSCSVCTLLAMTNHNINDVFGFYDCYIDENRKGEQTKELYYAFIELPKWWAVRADGVDGAVYDNNKKKASIYFNEPIEKRNVKLVEWHDEENRVYRKDYYNKMGYKYCTENVRVASSLINTLLRMGDGQGALQVCDTALFYNPDNSQIRQSKGMALYMTKDYKQADSVYTGLLADGDSSFLNLKYAGAARYMSGHALDGVELLEKAYEIDSTDVETVMLYGASLGKTYDRKRAYELFDLAETNMQPKKFLVNMLTTFRGDALERDGRWPEAEKLYYAAWKEDPTQLHFLYKISTQYWDVDPGLFQQEEKLQKTIFSRYTYLTAYMKTDKSQKYLYNYRPFLEAVCEDAFFRNADEVTMLAPDGKKTKLAVADLRALVAQLPQMPEDERLRREKMQEHIKKAREKEKELRKSGAKLDTLALSKEEKEKARKMLKDADLE